MQNQELLVINSILESKDVGVLFTQSSDDLFSGYGDVWAWTKDYYKKHKAIPHIDLVQVEFTDFEYIETKGPSIYHMDKLRKNHVRARMKNIMMQAANAIDEGDPEEIKERLQRSVASLDKYSGSAKDTNIMDFEVAEDYYDELRKKAEQMGGTPGIQTGISFFDANYTSGLSGGDLVIIFGYTGRGKSIFSTLICCNAYAQSFKPMIVTLEMNAQKVQQRAWTIMGSGLFRNSSLALGDLPADNFRTFRNRYEGKGKFITVTNDGMNELTPNVLQAKIDQHKPDLLVVDYAQLMSDNAKNDNMTARMMNMSKEFKALATANDIPIILISSATPESNSAVTEAPRVEQVAWSKQLAFDADLAIAVHKYEGTNMIAVVCRKNRNGEEFAGFLDWDIDNGIIKERFGLE